MMSSVGSESCSEVLEVEGRLEVVVLSVVSLLLEVVEEVVELE